jgi:hypothetical protein
MALVNGFPGHNAQATFADIRRDLEGMFARSAAGVMRAGVLPDNTSPVVVSRASMGVNVLDFRAVLNRQGAILVSNVGTGIVPLDAAPGANKRIDLIYVIQESADAPLSDPISGPRFGVVKGTAAATPTVPPLPAGVATALPLATVEIPSGATTTQSAGVVITQVYPYTATAGGLVRVRNTVELAAWVPAEGAQAFCAAENATYVRGASKWVSDERALTQFGGNTDSAGRAYVTSPWGVINSTITAVPTLRGSFMALPKTSETLSLITTLVMNESTATQISFRIRRDDTNTWFNSVQTVAFDVQWFRSLVV